MKLTYLDAGVDYAGTLDPAKLIFAQAARETAGHVARLGFTDLEWTRGESVFLTQMPNGDVSALVIEGLGTKNAVADAMYELTGISYDAPIGQDNVAMVLNDLCTLGPQPTTFAFKLDNSSTDKFLKNLVRVRELARGTKEACITARCTWGPGETATLKDIIMPNAVELCGAAIGFAKAKHVLNPTNIRAGDVMVFVASSGIHANGVSMARSDKVLNSMPNGYMTQIGEGKTYGEALLMPTHLYTGLMESCQELDIVYAINVTGHGLRKAMRAPQPFTYVIGDLPRPQPVFHAIQKYGGVDEREMYGNYNMGVGWIIIARPNAAIPVINAAKADGKHAWIGGYVEESAEKQVILTQKNITFKLEDLAIR